MLKLFHTEIHTPFQYPFTTAHGTKTDQPALLVALDFKGIPGFGEAPEINYYNVSVESMRQSLEEKRGVIERYALMDPERFWHFLHHLYPTQPFLVAALDIAGWDLFAKMRRTTVRGLWGVTGDQSPLTSYTIGFDDIAAMQEKIKAHPWPIYKVKLPDAATAVATVAQIRAVTDAEIRIDANGGWSVQDTLQVIPELERLGVTILEQPLAPEEDAAMPEIKAKSTLVLLADESCVGEKDVAKCAAGFHGINIKLTKCSGMTPARRMITEAKSLGLKVMMGSMCETSIGSAAIAQFLPLLDYVDMDGPLLLASDVAEGLSYDNGKVSLQKAPGLGIRLTKRVF